MQKNFRTLNLAIEFHQRCVQLRGPRYLTEQLLRASSSIALNVSEGSAKPTLKDQQRFYYIALGSLRESQTILALLAAKDEQAAGLADKLGAHLYGLTRRAQPFG